MSVRIDTQHAMKAARRRCRECYLCGSSSGELFGEHVVPKRLLGPPPATVKDAWAVELNAHKQCEATHKDAGDSFINAIATLHATPPSEWKAVVKRQAVSLVTDVINPRDGLYAPAFRLGSMLSAIVSWVRGHFAARYGSSLPTATKHCVLYPVPTASITAADSDRVSQEAQASHVVSVANAAAIRNDQ